MEEIDFVITWVNSADEEWQKNKTRYQQEEGTDAGVQRYRDWGLLKYWFRGVEKYAPWVRRIHLVVAGTLPDWLDTAHPRLHIVRHEDYIPAEYLPTFNSNVLELYLNRIEGLSEHFVYFNDDMFLLKSTSPETFFKKGKPRDMLAFQPVVANPENPVMSHTLLNNMLVLSKYFDKRREVAAHPGRYFKPGYPPLYFFYNLLELFFPLYTGLYTVHNPFPFCRSTFEELWEKEGELFLRVSANRYRGEGDITPYLFREWQKLSGNFTPANVKRGFRYFDVRDEEEKILKTIRKRKAQIICINDSCVAEWQDRKVQMLEAFEEILPDSCSYEITPGR